MRIIFTACIAMLLAFGAQAQQISPQMVEQMKKMQTMSPEQQQQLMQQMINGAATMQRCYQDAGGEAGVRELQAKGQAVKTQVETLCAEGKRDQAQAYALAQAREMEKDPRIGKLKQCAQDLSGQFPFMQHLSDPDAYLANNHICDAKEDFS